MRKEEIKIEYDKAISDRSKAWYSSRRCYDRIEEIVEEGLDQTKEPTVQVLRILEEVEAMTNHMRDHFLARNEARRVRAAGIILGFDPEARDNHF